MNGMTVFEPYTPLGAGELHYEFVGRTRVTIDPRLGPIEFVRDGEEVGCVCDAETGIVCAYHEKQEQRRLRVLFGLIRNKPTTWVDGL